jgi:hypothetical protein
MNNEIMMYGIAQKEQQGFDKAVEECKYRMSRYGVTPNMLILPPQMLLYMALAPEEKLSYKEGGPAAEARFEAGVAGFEARAFRGCGIFTSEPFEVSDDADSVQMLTRSSQIGEFYVMSPPQVDPGEKGMMHCCDILIFDEESDRHVRVTWAEALAATCVDAEGTIGGVGGPAGEGGAPTGVPFVHKTDKMGGEANETKTLKEWYGEAAKWAAATTDATTITKLGLPAAEGDDKYADLDKDIRIVVARPFIEHLMHNVIMTVSGRDTGATLFGPADMQLSANTQVKTIEGHVSAHALEPILRRSLSVRAHPLLACCACAVHGPLQGRDHQAAERSNHA